MAASIVELDETPMPVFICCFGGYDILFATPIDSSMMYCFINKYTPTNTDLLIVQWDDTIFSYSATVN